MIKYEIEALEYLSKLSEGGMRDALTMLDKCLALSTDLTLENVITALGTTDYDTLFDLTEALVKKDTVSIIDIIENVHLSGKDLKQFVKTYLNFILDVCKYDILHNFTYLQMPNLYDERLSKWDSATFQFCQRLMKSIVQLNADIKWDSNPKVVIESTLIMGAFDE